MRVRIRLLSLAAILAAGDDVLTEAESEAKERYVAPVKGRTMWYLPGLLPGASIEANEDLGLARLGRGGFIEAFGDLSARARASRSRTSPDRLRRAAARSGAGWA